MEVYLIKNCIMRMKKGFSLIPSLSKTDSYPVYTFWFKTDRLSFLIDTGVSMDAYEKLGTIGKFFELKEIDKSLNEQLKDSGCEGIDFIISTHLHFDHSSRNDLFPNIPIYVQNAEINDFISNSKNPMYINRNTHGINYKLVDGDITIYKDEDLSVTLIFTPGHSAGHQSVLVECMNHTFLILGDAGYLNEDGLLVPFEDKQSKMYPMALKSADKLNKIISAKCDTISIFHSHDIVKSDLNRSCVEKNSVVKIFLKEKSYASNT